MTFLFPLGLIALVSLPIIILLHLRRERLRRVTVPSLLLWQNLPRPKQGERRRNLPFSLLLLLHLLAAALLALAITRPQWLALLPIGERHLALVIDTSTSMGALEATNTTRLDEARSRALAEINSLAEHDTMAIIAAGSQPRLIASGTSESRTNLLAALESLQPGGTETDMAGALTLAQITLASGNNGRPYPNGKILVLSDLQPPADTTLPADRVEWVPIGTNLDNRAIVVLSARPRNRSATANVPSMGHDVYARVVNYGNTDRSTFLHLFTDGESRDTRQIRLSPNGETEVTWELPAGIAEVRLELEGSDTLPLDDQASLSLNQMRSVNTLLVSDNPAALQRVLKTIPEIGLEVIGVAEYTNSPFADQADLTIFDSTLPAAWPAGGVLVINPPVGASDVLTVAELRQLEAGIEYTIPQAEPLTTDPTHNATQDQMDTTVNLGGVNLGMAAVIETPPWAQVELSAADTPLIVHGSTGRSQISIWAFDLAQGNFTNKLAFPVLLARTVDRLTPPSPPAAMLLGQPLTFQASPRTDTIELHTPDGQTVQRTDIVQQPDTCCQPQTLASPPLAGLYTLVERQGDEILHEGQIAVNAGSPLESNLRQRPIPTDLVLSPFESTPTSESDQTDREQQPLWPWLAGVVLLVLMVEWFYVHR